jgi:hypothetical protein
MTTASSGLMPSQTSTDPASPPEKEKSGGILSGLFGSGDNKEEDDKNKENGSSSGDGNTADVKSEEGGILSGIFGSKDSKKEETTSPDKGSEPPVSTEKKEEGGFFSKLLSPSDDKKDGSSESSNATSDKKENTVESLASSSDTASSALSSAPLTSPPAEKSDESGMFTKMKNMILPGNDKPKDESNLNGESSDEDENASKDSDEETTDEEGSETEESSEDDDDEVEIFLTKIKTLRSKCKKMKQKYSVLKEKYDKIKSNGSFGNKDNSEFTKIVASLMAAEGAIKQQKIYLKEYAKKNKISMDGLGEEGDSFEEEGYSFEGERERVNEEVEQNKEESEDEKSSISGESNSGMSSLDSESDDESAETGSAPLAPVEVRSDVANMSEMTSDNNNNNNNNNAPAEPEMGAGLPITSNTESSGMQSESIPSSESSSATLSDNSAITGTSQQPSGTEFQSQPASSKISGGRSHFIRKSNIKTHKHHKRRNRHQTLKNIS